MNLLRRAWFLLRRRKRETELKAEIEAHIERVADELIATGVSPDEARQEARRRFGNPTVVVDESRSVWAFAWLDALLIDLRHTACALRRSPSFTAVALLTLALGIGANTAMFSVVDAIVLRPLPLSHGEQLITITNSGDAIGDMSWPDYVTIRDQAQSYHALSAYHHSDKYILTGVGEPVLIEGTTATANLFSLLGVSPALGRSFANDEDQPGKNHVVILSDGLWRRRFASDRNVIGRTITLDSEPYTVIGVAPPNFHFPFTHDAGLWAPMPHGVWDAEFKQLGGTYLRVVGRLNPGVDVSHAQSELDVIQTRRMEQLAREHPGAIVNSGRVLFLHKLQDLLIADVRTGMLLLLGAVAFVLLIACTNVTNLLLARATARQREIAIRAALGAGRGRIIRQMLTESTVLTLVAAALGLALAQLGLDTLVALLPDGVRRLADLSIDGRVLMFTVSIAIVTGVLFGMVPAVHASRLNLHDSLKEAGQTPSRRRVNVRAALLIGETALAMLLLVGAGLMLRSFSRLAHADPGFDPQDLLTARMELPNTRYKDDAQILVFYQAVRARLRTLPGIEGAALVMPLPYANFRLDPAVAIERSSPGLVDFVGLAEVRFISPEYFNLMGMHLVRGRTFTDFDDNEKAPRVAIINQTSAERFWPNDDPIGKRVILSTGIGKPPQPSEVVGVYADVHSHSLHEPAGAEILEPFGQAPFPGLFAVLRSKRSAGLANVLHAEVQAVDSGQPIAEVSSMDELLGESMQRQRLTMMLLGIFAAIALTLAAVGIYGVLSYTVTQRTRELGVRIALGAHRSQVMRMVVAQSLKPTLLGIAIGAVCALALTRVLASQLYGISATDPSTFVGIALLLVTVAALASLLPARRATRVDPMTALRGDG